MAAIEGSAYSVVEAAGERARGLVYVDAQTGRTTVDPALEPAALAARAANGSVYDPEAGWVPLSYYEENGPEYTAALAQLIARQLGPGYRVLPVPAAAAPPPDPAAPLY